jgi:septal ring factor EnvC (AmiA/AmiB activator)
MTPFRFRLARVLDWYRKQCELEESRLHARSAAVVETVREIARIQAERDAMEKEVFQSSSASALDLIAMEFHRQSTKRHEGHLGEELQRRQQALETQRATVEGARRRVRLLEKLRERRLAEHSSAAEQELEELAADAFRAASFRQSHIPS